MGMANQNASMRAALILAALLVLLSAGGVSAAQVRMAGKLNVAANTPLLAFSTDPTVQQVLSQDLSAAHRGGVTIGRTPRTITVTLTEQQLKPGVSLGEMAPGDPQVADLIKAAGATPPPLGDTGDQYDEAALARRMAERGMGPQDTPMQQMIKSFGEPESFGPPLPCEARSLPVAGCAPVPASEPTPRPKPGSPAYTGDTQEYMEQGRSARRLFGRDDKTYDTVIVAHATISGSSDEMTVVAVTHPGEDTHDTKKLMAEEIANSVLH